MSVTYVAIGWNRHKVVYDLVVAVGVAAYIGVFVFVDLLVLGARGPDGMVLALRALGTCSLVMLHIVLAIGPACRLWPGLLPMLYNRRHLGVATFLVALSHAALSTIYYHGFGVANPLASLLTANPRFDSFTQFPFELLGLAALIILLLMAATSHDFWLKQFTPRAWKRLHMLVYLAYGLLVMHVALGAMQAERSPMYPVLLGVGIVALTALHVASGLRGGRPSILHQRESDANGWLDAGPAGTMPDLRARVVCPTQGAKIAVFRNGDRFSAISNVCAHQGGPLGEGKIIDGCITCPWHGYQYKPADGRSPEPFTDRVPTYRVRIDGGRVWVDPTPLAPGTPVEPAVMARADHA